MNLYKHYLEKLAARYQLPAAGKKIMWESGANMGKALMGQSDVRAGVTHALNTRRLYGPSKADVVTAKRKNMNAFGLKTGGTIVDENAVAKNTSMPAGKNRVSLINKDVYGKKARNNAIDTGLDYVSKLSINVTDKQKQQMTDKFVGDVRKRRRQTIAHESFHANAPKKIRDSEFLAHAYGGWKGTKGGVIDKTKQVFENIKHYGKTRQDLPGARLVNMMRSPVKTIGNAVSRITRPSFTPTWGKMKPTGASGTIKQITKI